ncbi:hypothetical protein Tco_1229999 [Tanacetum coccineum]
MDSQSSTFCRIRPNTKEEIVVIEEEKEKSIIDVDEFVQTAKENMWNINEKGSNKQEYRPKAASKTGQQDNVVEDKRMGNKNVKDRREYGVEIDCNRRNEFDFFISQKLYPTPFETSKWSHEMVNYFKARWESMNVNSEIYEEEDVLEDINYDGKYIEENEIVRVDGVIQPPV